MDRLAELAEFDRSIAGLVDQDFIGAGFTPDEVFAYRNRVGPEDGLIPRIYPNEYQATDRPNVFGDVAATFGNEEIDQGLSLAFNPEVSTYEALPANMQGGVMEPFNRQVMKLLDLPLGLLSAAYGVGQKGIALGAETFAVGTANETRLARDLIGMTEVAGVGPEARLLSAIAETGGGAAAVQTVADRANQRGPVPTMYSNPVTGRAPVTFDDVEASMEEAAPTTFPAQGVGADVVGGLPDIPAPFLDDRIAELDAEVKALRQNFLDNPTDAAAFDEYKSVQRMRNDLKDQRAVSRAEGRDVAPETVDTSYRGG